ncbi:MAG TPA: hypothetical protein VFZ46_04845 [Nitrososphaeraceae archaeon]
MKIFFAKSIVLVFVSFTIILLSNIQIPNIPIFAQEDDKTGFGVQERERAGLHAGNDSRTNDEKRGFGVQERERAGLHAGNDSRILNNDYTRLILIVTVVVIIGVSSYALYKIYLIRRKSNQSKLKK